MSLHSYILDDEHQPRVVSDDEWLTWMSQGFEKTKRVAQTDVGDVSVSTVFLGIDHNWHDDGPPILFETMIFRGEHADWQDRYRTWDEAVAGHERVVAELTEGRAP